MIKKIKALEGVGEIPAELCAVLEHATAEYEREGAFFLEEGYIRRVMEKTRAFPRVGD